MKNFVVGDIQGCYAGLKGLLKKAEFRPKKDKLWAVGDLVARGPQSLETLEYLYDLGPHFDTVLGNHDLHLIATAHGFNKAKPQDKLDSLLKHKRFNKYIDWLKTKELALSPKDNVLITHAGLYPTWSIKKAQKLSGEVKSLLSSKQSDKLLANMYGNLPNKWDKSLEGHARIRFIINAFTRMRYLRKDLSLDFGVKCHPDVAGDEFLPWFNIQNDKLEADHTLLFGHWASLLGDMPKHMPHTASIVALDTGYVWGNSMSLFCLENDKTIRFSR